MFSPKICFHMLEDHLLISERDGVSTSLKLPTKLILRTSFCLLGPSLMQTTPPLQGARRFAH
uniref:Putative ovule protein n=1 Tax=Solanum chacoense TaxID=4108 RepID=A0A0V0GWL0_SOLCH